MAYRLFFICLTYPTEGVGALQNLIQRGHKSTMITALRCSAGIDAGDVYIKQSLGLHGSAEEIFLRADGVIQQMIQRIVLEEPDATPQLGESIVFSRRTPDQSSLSLCPDGDLSSWYDPSVCLMQRIILMLF